MSNNSIDPAADLLIHKIFEEQVERTPDTVAVIFGERQLTFRELDTSANQLARHLGKQGVGPGIFVAVCIERSMEAIVSLMAIFKAGGVYVPLDPAYPRERLSFMLDDSKAAIILTQENLLEIVPQCDAAIVCLDREREAICNEKIENLSPDLNAEHPAYAIYTSGSTGTPKGVLISHASIAGHCLQMTRHWRLNPDDRVHQFASLSFDGSLEQILLPLLTGASVLLRGNKVWTPLQFSKEITNYGLTVLCLPPSILHEWAQHLVEFPEHSPAHQPRMIICGGEELRSRTIEIMKLTTLRSVRLLNVYGPTEATITTSMFEVDTIAHDGVVPKRVPIGRPMLNRTIYILDPYGNMVPSGVSGEIHIGGDYLACGYLNRPELTAAKFVPDPFNKKPGARLYKTGDLGRYLPDGNIEFLGRIDHQVKIRAFRIEPGEIETVLVQHPAVLETVVLAREDQAGEKRLTAYIVSRGRGKLTASELRSHLSKHLPDYMIPSVFVMLDSMPLTVNGKVDRRALPLPDRTRPELDEIHAVPRNEIERKLAAIWTEVLGLEQVGINDNFFELGGDSLSAIRVMSRFQNFPGLDLSHVSLFEAPTIAELAHRINDAHVRPSGMKLRPVLSQSCNGNAPLSFGQQEIWLSAQLWPDVPVYNETFTIYMKGEFNPVVLEQALNNLIVRHEILRTAFIMKDGRTVQSVRKEAILKLRVDDLRSFQMSDREAEAIHRATAAARWPFSLDGPPLIRALLVRLDDSDYRLYMVLHHLVTDGVSISGILIPELRTNYKSLINGAAPLMRELPVQYSDYAKWQHEWMQGPVLENHLAYWRKQLDGIQTLDLPTDRPRPPIQSFRGAFHPMALPGELTYELKALGRREGCTLYMVLLSAFKAMLRRYTYQDDITVGTVEAGRSSTELEPLLGYFLNMLVVRTSLSGDPEFREFLHQVRQVSLKAYNHKDLPFILLVEALKPPRDPSRHPFFQVAFVMEPVYPADESGWKVSQLEVQTGTSKFDLTLELDEREEQIIGRFEYNTDLFDASTIKRMAGHFQRILEGIIADPHQRLSQLPLLTEAEQHHLRVEWNNTGADYPRDKCIHELFEAQVEKTPDATAVVFEDRRLTYRQLNERANRLAHHLQSLGVSADVRVGIYLERSLEMLVGLFGILKAGGAYIPLDPVYPSDRLAFMLEDAGPPVLLTQRKLQGNLPPHHSLVICIDDFDLRMEEGTAPSAITGRQSNLAYILYTSGSTGKPKGVQIPHRAVVNFLTAMRKQTGMTDADTLLAVTTLSFDIAVLELFLPLTVGASIVLSRREIANDGERLSLLLDEAKVTVMQATPVTWQMLIESGWQGSQTLTILCGGEPLHQDLANQLVSRSASVWNLYGPTETTIWSSIFRVQAGQPVTIGRPIANTRFYILDQYLHMVPIGVPGELFISGDGLARGYLNRPELTDEKFISNPFSNEPGALMYRTGDIARYLPDGNVEYLGRVDNQVKIRGYRIELGEIEAILREHTAIRNAAVIVREDKPGDRRLVGYVVVDRTDATGNDLRQYLQGKVPEYMIPSFFVFLDQFPLTPNGKVDRRALPAPDLERPDLDDSFVGPRTPVEEILADIWCEVLGLRKVGIRDNFFELGGYSLLAIQVMSRLRTTFQVEMSLRSLFETPTVAGLAIRIAENQSEVADPEELDRILAELEGTASDTVSGFGEAKDERDE